MTRRSTAAPSVPWAITFADMALLLLCCFVMLASADTPTLAKQPDYAARNAADAATLLRN